MAGRRSRIGDAIGDRATIAGLPGNKVTHEIVAGGRFDVVCAELLAQGVLIDYVEAWTEGGKAKAAKKLKVKYSCPDCGINAWAKPDCRFICGECETEMEAREG